jgi:hypothetical protein
VRLSVLHASSCGSALPLGGYWNQYDGLRGLSGSHDLDSVLLGTESEWATRDEKVQAFRSPPPTARALLWV